MSEKKPIEYEILDNFWNKQKFIKYTNYERNKAYYNINRRLALNHPLISASLTRIGINGGQVIKWWQLFISQLYPNNKPYWLLTKTKKALKEKTKYKPSEGAIKFYCKMNKCERKDVLKAFEFFPDEIEKELKYIEKTYKDEI